ncbi:hypothetical protein QC762_0069030 [Podospora pseudocomata]|uniref:Uncharacterized protein n=1 Tax=Podospora pseudocomata TaxID=2093779 RepID=A0ABR0GGG2_9PEZI|nr:hypothetical protein QC762_0069030 [Podospora pseudocomata]
MPDSGSALRIKCYRPGTRDSSAFAIAVRPQLPLRPLGYGVGCPSTKDIGIHEIKAWIFCMLET